MNLVLAIKSHLESRRREHLEVDHVLRKLDVATSADGHHFGSQTAPSMHRNALLKALRNVSTPLLEPIASALEVACEELPWRVDRGLFYAGEADVGAGYLNGNMHCVLVGPDGCALKSDDLLFGLFLLTPQTLYRDHNHKAPELYLNLSGVSGWRFGGGSWRDYDPGTILWNAPYAVHATRVYGEPWLSIFAWTDHIDSICNVVPADDWHDVETLLHRDNDG